MRPTRPCAVPADCPRVYLWPVTSPLRFRGHSTFFATFLVLGRAGGLFRCQPQPVQFDGAVQGLLEELVVLDDGGALEEAAEVIRAEL